MKKTLFILIACLFSMASFADSILIETFEYGNHDLETPVGWVCEDHSWAAGYLAKDHNRIPHTYNWYAFTNADDSWMFMNSFMSSEIKYRFYFWAISDGEYDVEFWAGNGPSPDQMTEMLFTKSVNNSEYQIFSEYIQTLSANYQYFGIHAVAHEGAFYLTIDDIEIDMVVKYEISANPTNSSTSIYPGQQVSYEFDVTNLGYEPIDVIFSPKHDYFTDIHFTVEGNSCTTFHLEPDETKKVTTEATLRPEITAGTTCWLDIVLTLDCNCATAMTTLWVTVLDPDAIDEHESANSIQQVEVFDLTGKKVDPTYLKAGIYIERTTSEKGVTTRKFVKK